AHRAAWRVPRTSLPRTSPPIPHPSGRGRPTPGRPAPAPPGRRGPPPRAPGDPIQFRLAGRVEAIGRVLHARCRERLSYLLQAGPGDPPVYLTWLLRSAPGGCVV